MVAAACEIAGSGAAITCHVIGRLPISARLIVRLPVPGVIVTEVSLADGRRSLRVMPVIEQITPTAATPFQTAARACRRVMLDPGLFFFPRWAIAESVAHDLAREAR